MTTISVPRSRRSAVWTHIGGAAAQLLAPVMRWWASETAETLEGYPRPDDSPEGHAPGHDSDRVLLFGAGPAVGWGVRTHDLALPGSLARALTARTGRGSSVHVVADANLRIEHALPALTGLRLSRYDGIIVILGVNDAVRLTPIRVWRRHLRKVLRAIAEASPTGTQVTVAGIQPIRSMGLFDSFLGGVAQSRAVAMNRVTVQVCAEFENTRFVPTAARARPTRPGGRHMSPQDFAAWAEVLADHIAPLLNGSHHLDGDRRREGPSAVSGDAVKRTGDDVARLDGAARDRLDRIVSLAKRAFHTEFAVVSLLDGDRRRQLGGTASGGLAEIAQFPSLYDFAGSGEDVMIVRDARADERFANHPMVVGEPHIRFIADFPIESPAGRRVGALCVLACTPRRRADDIDVDFLRQLALMAQRELWEVL